MDSEVEGVSDLSSCISETQNTPCTHIIYEWMGHNVNWSPDFILWMMEYPGGLYRRWHSSFEQRNEKYYWIIVLNPKQLGAFNFIIIL